MNSLWFDNKAKILIASAVSGTFAPLLLAWNGTSSWHVAIGIAAAADVTAFLGWLVPGYKAPAVVAPVKRAPARRKKVV